jgi:hypothetical protein
VEGWGVSPVQAGGDARLSTDGTALGLSLCLFLKDCVDLSDLRLGGVQRAGVIDYEIGFLDLNGIRELGRHTAAHLPARSFGVDFEAFGEAAYPLLVRTGDHDQAIKAVARPRLKNERRLDDRNGVRVSATHFFHPFILAMDYRGVNDLVQFIDPGVSTSLRISKGSLGQFGSVDRPVGVQDARPEMPNDLVVHRLSWLHEFMGDVVGLDEVRAARG